MKKVLILFLFIILISPLAGQAEVAISGPANAAIIGGVNTATLSWKNPQNSLFSKIIIFQSIVPIEAYYTYGAVEDYCDKIYEGDAETYTDSGLAENLPYYYILFARDQSGNYSKAVVLEKKPVGQVEKEKNIIEKKINTLAGATSATVNQISLNEAGIVYNFNQAVNKELRPESRRLALFIIVKSPHSLSENGKNSISYFINEGTPTTIFLGSGERAGVLNSYLSVFDKLPRNELEWQDIIKIANGRWPDERNIESEEQASNTFFSAIYKRKPDMNNPKDNAAVTVIAYGLRPSNRNMENEKNAIKIYRSIFKKSPVDAVEWDLVRAIAYSGAIR